jgi:hypothetical protein
MNEPTQPTTPPFRWYSTVESAENLEFSVLAVLESVGAVTLSLWLAWHFQTYTHLMVAIVIAPLLLLRTDESVELGLRWYGGFLEFMSGGDEERMMIFFSLIGLIFIFLLWFIIPFYSWLLITLIFVFSRLLLFTEAIYQLLDKLEGLGGRLVLLVFVLLVLVFGVVTAGEIVVVSLIIKFAATTFTCFQQLLQQRSGNCLHVIPLNWYRIVLATDMVHPPELLPGIELPKYQVLTGEFSEFLCSEWIGKLITQSDVFGKMFRVINGIFLFLPALLYRWSLKSSALFYLPFLWIIGTSVRRQHLQLHIDEQLTLWKESALAMIGLIYAFIVVIFFTALPLFFRIKLQHLALPQHELIDLIVPFFVTFEWEAWHVARLIAALITIGTWLYVDRILIQRRFRQEVGCSEAQVIFHLLRARQLLSLFTLGCGFYVLYDVIPWTEIFKDFQWLPSK